MSRKQTFLPIWPGIAIGRAILFDEDKYAVYSFIGLNEGASVLNIPYNHTWSRGVVSNVHDVGDYEKFFFNKSAVVGPSGYSASVGENDAGEKVIATSDAAEELFPRGRFGISFQWYSSYSDEWTHETAPIEWADTIWDNFVFPNPYPLEL